LQWSEETGFPEQWTHFKTDKPLVIECCCGKAEFLVEEAKKYPQKQFVGIDYAEPVLQRAVKRIYESGVQNIRLFLNDIGDIFTHLADSIELERIYINFPDPWPKKRHWNRRIINGDTLRKIHSRMSIDTELIMVTDHDGYAEWIEACLNSLDFFTPIGDTWYSDDMPEFHDSTYMNKAREWGHRFYFFRVKRSD